MKKAKSPVSPPIISIGDPIALIEMTARSGKQLSRLSAGRVSVWLVASEDFTSGWKTRSDSRESRGSDLVPTALCGTFCDKRAESGRGLQSGYCGDFRDQKFATSQLRIGWAECHSSRNLSKQTRRRFFGCMISKPRSFGPGRPTLTGMEKRSAVCMQSFAVKVKSTFRRITVLARSPR